MACLQHHRLYFDTQSSWNVVTGAIAEHVPAALGLLHVTSARLTIPVSENGQVAKAGKETKEVELPPY